MTTSSPEVALADQLLRELDTRPPPEPGQGRLKHVRYTHEAMIDLIIRNGDLPPGQRLTQGKIAETFGYTEGWISNVLASDSFKAAMAARREEIVDPDLRATIKERFEGMLIRSLQRLNEKLNQPTPSDRVVLEAAALGARALGYLGGDGGNTPPPPRTDRLQVIAERLVVLQSNIRERVLNEKDGVSVEILPAAASR